MKKFVSVILCLALVFGLTGTAFAGENIKNNDLNIQAYKLNENSIIVKEINSNTTSLISCEKNGEIEKTTVKDLETGEEYYFVRNNKENTLYSSMTNYKGSIENVQTDKLARSKSDTTTKKISYKELAAYIAVGAGAAAIVSGIIGIIGYSAAAGIVTIVGGILTVINGGLALASKSSGIKVTLTKEKRTKIQAGQKFTYYVTEITNVATY